MIFPQIAFFTRAMIAHKKIHFSPLVTTSQLFPFLDLLPLVPPIYQTSLHCFSSNFEDFFYIILLALEGGHDPCIRGINLVLSQNIIYFFFGSFQLLLMPSFPTIPLHFLPWINLSPCKSVLYRAHAPPPQSIGKFLHFQPIFTSQE